MLISLLDTALRLSARRRVGNIFLCILGRFLRASRYPRLPLINDGWHQIARLALLSRGTSLLGKIIHHLKACLSPPVPGKGKVDVPLKDGITDEYN